MPEPTPSDSQDEPRRRDDGADLRERLAAIEHERWADWQRYLHGQCSTINATGAFALTDALVIPSNLVERWERQIATPYGDLSEAEKDTDRRQVDRYWWLIAELLADRDEARTKLARCREDRDEYGGQAAAAERDAERLRADVAQLTVDRDSLIKAGEALATERDEAKQLVVDVRASAVKGFGEVRVQLLTALGVTDDRKTTLVQYVVALTAERDEAQALLRLAPHHQQQVETLEYELVQARAEVVRLTAERDEARALVRTVEAFGTGYIWRRPALADIVLDPTEVVTLVAADRLASWERVEAERDAMRRSVEELSAFIESRHYTAQARQILDRHRLRPVDRMAPSTPPSTPQSDVQGEVAVTDAVEAPGGSEGEPSRMDCAERCEVPAGVRILESPPSRHAWSDVVRCPNDGCEKTFLVIRNERPHDA